MQRIRPGQVVASRRVTVTSSGKIKARKNPKKDALEKSVDKTPFGPLIGALDFGKKRKKAKKGKARKARNTRKRNASTYGTSYFVSMAAAVRYYKDYHYSDTKAAVLRKLSEGEIHIGKPPLKAGERLGTTDGGKRYTVTTANPSRNAKMSRFDRCVKSVTERGGAYDARAVCAAAGRRKYGKKKFQAMAKAGKARAARKRAKR